jgi:hypothetical protein
LHPEAAIDPHLSGVVQPRNAEDDLTLRLAKPFDQGMMGVARMLGHHATETIEYFLDGLVEFFFARIPAQNFSKNGFEFLVDMDHDRRIPVLEFATRS